MPFPGSRERSFLELERPKVVRFRLFASREQALEAAGLRE
jgi:hypothetical protein